MKKLSEKEDTLILSEVLDSQKSLKEFIKMNVIHPDEIRGIVLIWEEKINE